MVSAVAAERREPVGRLPFTSFSDISYNSASMSATESYESLTFPEIPAVGNPDDRDLLRAILAGQRALGLFYVALESGLEGETLYGVRLLHRDWRRRERDLVSFGEGLRRDLGDREKVASSLPANEEITPFVEGYANGTAKAAVEFLGGFAARALIARRLVPWKSDNERLVAHFRYCLEQEDEHLGTIELFTGLV